MADSVRAYTHSPRGRALVGTEHLVMMNISPITLSPESFQAVTAESLETA